MRPAPAPPIRLSAEPRVYDIKFGGGPIRLIPHRRPRPVLFDQGRDDAVRVPVEELAEIIRLLEHGATYARDRQHQIAVVERQRARLQHHNTMIGAARG